MSNNGAQLNAVSPYVLSMCGGKGGWLIQLGHISSGAIRLYRDTIFCKQNRILHSVMDHQLALLV